MTSATIARRTGTLATAALSALVVSACDSSLAQAPGDVDSVIVLAADSLWAEIGDSVMAAMEPEIETVRRDPIFKLTQISPAQDVRWNELKTFKQVLAIGVAADSWVAEALAEAGAEASGTTVVETYDVWSRGQRVVALAVPAEGSAQAVLDTVAWLARHYDERFREYAVQRMYTTPPDSVLRDSLLATAGYGALFPRVYRSGVPAPGLRTFTNATTTGGNLYRTFVVGTVPGTNLPAPERLLAWRDSVSAVAHRPAQAVREGLVRVDTLQVNGAPALEIQGVWVVEDPDWPMSGPFLMRAIPCPARNETVFVDAFLYAPNRSKYEYMIQLETILDTFACAS